MSTQAFYDDLAEYYDLIYADWDASMARHGAAIDTLLKRLLPGRNPGEVRVLDVAAGIGTQSLPLARLGYEVVARDISAGAIERLRREARGRGLAIDAATADMARVEASVRGRFEAVIAFDNAVPHLLSDELILRAFRAFRSVLRSRGVLLLSVRDYAALSADTPTVHSYGERSRGGRSYRVGQRWRWLDRARYRTTLLLEELRSGQWETVVSTDSTYYAVSASTLLRLMGEAGFSESSVMDVDFMQPVLGARNALDASER